jgi:hypothetical protein
MGSVPHKHRDNTLEINTASPNLCENSFGRIIFTMTYGLDSIITIIGIILKNNL